jgi:AcrR family transcriptional regulator
MTNPDWSDNQPTPHRAHSPKELRLPEDTKEKIVAGAYRAIVRGGYANTSVKDIAAEAGVAPGLVHYYFATKEELLVAAIDHCCDNNSGIAQQMAALAPLDAARAAIENEKQQLRSDPDSYLLVLDMFGVGLHNPAIAKAVRRFIDERREMIVGIGAALLEQAPSRPTMPIDAISSAVWGAVVGISLQKLIDPEFDSDAALDALADMVFTYLPISIGQEVG